MDESGLMTQQEIEAYNLAKYLRNQQLQQAQVQGTASPGLNLLGQGAGIYAGSQLLGGGSASALSGATGTALSDIGLESLGALGASGGASTTAAAGAPLAASSAWGTVLPIGAAALGTYLIANALLDKPSTRDIAKKHTGQLLSQGKDNPTWQAYVQGMRKQYESAPTGKAFAGKYDTWDKYKKAGLEAGDLTGVYGNLKTFGPDWAGYGFDRQKQIVQALIDADLYKSKKGEVEITDAAKAQALRDQILKTALPKSTTPAVVAPVVAPSSAPIISFKEGVNGTKIPTFSYSPEYLAYKEAQNAKS